MSFRYRLDWRAFCVVGIWLHVTSGLLYQLWIELRRSTGSFRSWFSHWRSFHQASLLNACWVPRDTWSVFKGKQLNHEKRETAVYSSTIALKGSYYKLCKACMAIWVPGAHYVLYPSRDLCNALSGHSCSEKDKLMTPGFFGHELCLTLLRSRPGNTSGGFQAAPASCSPLLLKFPQWRHPLRESRKSINK